MSRALTVAEASSSVRPACSAPTSSGPRGTETVKRVDAYATAPFRAMTVDGMAEFDLSYSPPLAHPGTSFRWPPPAWVREHRLDADRAALRGADVS